MTLDFLAPSDCKVWHHTITATKHFGFAQTNSLPAHYLVHSTGHSPVWSGVWTRHLLALFLSEIWIILGHQKHLLYGSFVVTWQRLLLIWYLTKLYKVLHNGAKTLQVDCISTHFCKVLPISAKLLLSASESVGIRFIALMVEEFWWSTKCQRFSLWCLHRTSRQRQPGASFPFLFFYCLVAREEALEWNVEAVQIPWLLLQAFSFTALFEYM